MGIGSKGMEVDPNAGLELGMGEGVEVGPDTGAYIVVGVVGARCVSGRRTYPLRCL